MYRFRLHENPDYGWQPRLSSRDFFSVLSNLTAIKIRGTYSERGTLATNSRTRRRSVWLVVVRRRNDNVLFTVFRNRCRVPGRRFAADGSARRSRIAGQLGGDVHLSRGVHRTVLRIVRARFATRTHQRWPILAVRPVQLSRSRLHLRRGYG